ncbi:DUF3307 domain-containing protein [Flavobacterium sp. SM2513]|uniref:DUF3307 domain-containing protein n=1 Tax=Flavobacterium sp. SM2513 TaxID=3424766 RepID=UPI003D7F8515
MLIFVMKLLLAHFLGDFVLQPTKWVKEKSKPKYLGYHILVHVGLLLVLFELQWLYWPVYLMVGFSHAAIDFVKNYIQNKKNKIFLFLLDQALHLFVLMGIVYWYYPFEIVLQEGDKLKIGLVVLALVLLTEVTAVTIKVLLSNWKLKDSSLNSAGKYIGIIERLFIFGFILMHYWEGIGFLLAAKSVFRFGDLNKGNDRNLTEYVLVGTLLSFGFAIIIALLVTHFYSIII